MRVLSFAGLILFLSISPAAGMQWIVDLSGGGDFTTIQEAIDASRSSDDIIVMPGTYVENIDYLGKNVWIRGQGGPEVTTIDGSGGPYGAGTCVTFQSHEDAEAILEGFTITGGHGTDLGYLCGGGVRCLGTWPSIVNCVFVGNNVDHGGGIFMEFSAPQIYGCQFISNTAWRYGGGINGSGSPHVVNCLFEGNVTGSGGGAFGSGNTIAVFEDCTFRSNTSNYKGGAIDLGAANANATFINCLFEANRANGQNGGAISIHECSPSIEDCIFADNFASGRGGGIITLDGGTAKIINCTFIGNGSETAGGNVSIDSGAQPFIYNCIIADATKGGGISRTSNNFPYLSCNDVCGNMGGNYVGIPDQTGIDGNISEDPLLCDPANGDYFLALDSPCAPYTPPNPECSLIGARGIGCGFQEIEAPRPNQARLSLSPAYPDPFNGTTRITYVIPAGDGRSRVALRIYDTAGRKIRTLFDGYRDSGQFLAEWDGTHDAGVHVVRGLYLYRLQVNDEERSGRVVLLR